MIKLDGVTKAFGTLKAVDNLTLSIPPGELFCFLGPNGAGKTTTIKMLVGLLSPDSGTIEINGFDMAQNPTQAKQHIGYVPDSPFLYDKLTGVEFLTIVGGLYGMQRQEIDEQIALYRHHLDIGDWLNDVIEGYSQGMKQRVVFAAALFHEPKILVIDEPMVGLDPKTARIVKDLLRERASQGTTIFLSTHNLNVAEELAHRISIIHQGRLLHTGTLDEFRQITHQDGNLEEVFLRIVEESLPAESSVTNHS
jgi:ABC-2 type transport system ATP-binding protein